MITLDKIYVHAMGVYAKPNTHGINRDQVFDNDWVEGFTVIPEGVYGSSTASLMDPRGFTIECSANVLAEIMLLGVVDKGQISIPCRYHPAGDSTNRAVLIPKGGKVDQSIMEEIERKRQSLIPSDLKPGHQYLCHNGEMITWLGRCHARSWKDLSDPFTYRDRRSDFYMTVTQYGGEIRQYSKALGISREVQSGVVDWDYIHRYFRNAIYSQEKFTNLKLRWEKNANGAGALDGDVLYLRWGKSGINIHTWEQIEGIDNRTFRSLERVAVRLVTTDVFGRVFDNEIR